MITQLRRTASATIVGTAVLTGAFLASETVRAAPTPVPVGTPPVAVITLPKNIYAGVPITISGAKSSANGGVSEWEWDLDGNGRFERSSLSSPWVSKAFGQGPHKVSLRVRSEAGLVSTTSKTFKARAVPDALSEPAAPATVTATADGTAVDVTWTEALGADAITYRVTNVGDADADPIYVPATGDLEARFEDLVPESYSIRVAGINGAGTGPATEATAEVLAKGTSSSSATPTATSSAGATGSPGAEPTDVSSTPAATEAASNGGGDNRDTIGFVLIGIGGVVLLGAGITALVAGWRRRRRSSDASTGV